MPAAPRFESQSEDDMEPETPTEPEAAPRNGGSKKSKVGAQAGGPTSWLQQRPEKEGTKAGQRARKRRGCAGSRAACWLRVGLAYLWS